MNLFEQASAAFHASGEHVSLRRHYWRLMSEHDARRRATLDGLSASLRKSLDVLNAAKPKRRFDYGKALQYTPGVVAVPRG